MKSLILLGALLMPACSHFTESGRLDRAYAKHMKEVKQMRVAREQRRTLNLAAGLRSRNPIIGVEP